MNRWEQAAWAAGAAGVLASVLGWVLEPRVFAYAWLAAVTGWIGWPLGCIALVFVHELTGGRWGSLISRQLASGITTLPLLLLAVLPILSELNRLYPWLRPEEAGHLENTFYLNVPFAAGRGVVYLLIWFALGTLALRHLAGRLRTKLAPIALMLLGLTVTFGSIDATMSLDPKFISSNYGMIAAAQGGLLALSMCVLGAARDPSLTQNGLDVLGRLLQGLLVLWAYLDFMQVLIVWQSDLPDEAGWYLARSTHGWGTVAGLVAAGHFFLPFFALMSPGLRRSRGGIGAIALLLIAMEIARAWWLVVPASGLGFSWIDVAAMLAIGGLSAGLALRGFHARLPATAVSHV